MLNSLKYQEKFTLIIIGNPKLREKLSDVEDFNFDFVQNFIFALIKKHSKKGRKSP